MLILMLLGCQGLSPEDDGDACAVAGVDCNAPSDGTISMNGCIVDSTEQLGTPDGVCVMNAGASDRCAALTMITSCPEFQGLLGMSGWLAGEITLPAAPLFYGADSAWAYRCIGSDGQVVDAFAINERIPAHQVGDYGYAPLSHPRTTFQFSTDGQLLGIKREFKGSDRWETWCCNGNETTVATWGDYLEVDCWGGNGTYREWYPEDFR